LQHVGVVRYSAAGYSSGGYLANSQIDGTVYTGSQQQWLTRNSQVGKYLNGVWNHVFVGVAGAPAAHCSDVGGSPYTVVPSTPSIAEKPFLSADPGSGKFSLNIPALRTGSVGPDWSAGTTVGFENVYVATNSTDTAESINAKLAAGLHVVLTPGTYELTAPLKLSVAGQVLLGLGFPTLISAAGTPVIQVCGAPCRLPW
jgi:hypothetical protein